MPDFVWLQGASDRAEAGRQGMFDCLARLGRRNVDVGAETAGREQPDMLTTEAIQALLKK
jgi:hypothetical protein